MRRNYYWGVLAAVLGVGSLAWFVGFERGFTRATSIQRTDDQTEQRVRQWIVQKNPGATLKDFDTFPKLLLETSKAAGLDYRLVMAIIEIESEWNPGAVSHKGAIGLMQLMPATAKLMADKLHLENYRAPVSDRKTGYQSLGSLGDPAVNLILGIEYLREQVQRYGASPTALQSYNRGPERATQHWPFDQYAKAVALLFLRLVHET